MMASRGSVITILVSLFIVAITMVSAAGDTRALQSPAVIPEDKYKDLAPIPEEIKQRFLFLKSCAQKLAEECLKEIYVYIYIFRNHNYALSNKCCQKLMYMGRKCYDVVVKELVSELRRGGEKSVAIFSSWSVMTWNKCAAVASSPAPSPTAIPENKYEDLAPTPEQKQLRLFLKSCTKKMTDKCREEIYINIVDNLGVSKNKKCCQELMYMGRKCHDAVVKEIVSEFQSIQKKSVAIFSWSVMAWNECAALASLPAPSPY